jgi:hypothetical protein
MSTAKKENCQLLRRPAQLIVVEKAMSGRLACVNIHSREAHTPSSCGFFRADFRRPFFEIKGVG